MFNWKAVIVGGFCFSIAPTFCVFFGLLLLAGLFLPRKIFYAADSWLFDHSQRVVLFFYRNVWGRKLILYGDVEEFQKRQENILFISNHQTALDWVIAEMLAAVQGDIGKTRYVMKDQIRMIPLFGSYFRAHGCVYVKRGRIRGEGSFDEEYVVRQFDRLRQDEVPLWLVIFPEGTRFNPKKPAEVERSQAFARANGLSVCDEVLTPRSKAVYLALRSLNCRFDAIYDCTIGLSSTIPRDSCQSNLDDSVDNEAKLAKPRRRCAPGMFGFLQRPCDIHVHIRRIPTSDMPDATLGEDYIRKWLHERFVAKEDLLKKFLYGDEKTRGRFGPDGVEVHTPLIRTIGSTVMWILINVPLFFTPVGRLTYGFSSLVAMVLGYAYVLITG